MASLGYKLAPARMTGEAAAIMSIRLGENENKGKPTALAIVSNCLTPYRLAAHTRIARELSDVRLSSVFTHEQGDAAWSLSPPAEINPVMFGPGEPVADQPRRSNALKEWRRGGRIIRWLLENKIDVVAMMGYNDLGRVRIMRWCRRRGLPYLLWGDSNARGDLATGVRKAIKSAVVTPLVMGAAGVLVCGRLGREYFLNYGASPERIFYFPYEPDYSIIENTTEAAIKSARQNLGLAPDRRRLIFAGRLVPVKRVDLLIDAFATVARQRPQWDLVIVGAGPLRDELRARVPADLASRVTWAGFIAEPAMMAAVYRACDVLVLPSDYEPWGVVVNEATAGGLAVVCSDVVGAGYELVRDGVNGQVFHAGDLMGLRVALASVTDAGTIDQMKGKSRSVLADWRRDADPVAGLAKAVRAVVR